MPSSIYITKKQIKEKGESVLGKTFGEIDNTGMIEKAKGKLGQIIEKSVFEIETNSLPEPDFKEAGVELKVTPYRKNKNGTYSAKERLVLNIINYFDEYLKTFETSSFWKKNKSLYIIFYEYSDSLTLDKLKITYDLLFEYPEEDLATIKKDWKIIHDKILSGKAHEISEADTMYLAACTKDSKARANKKQPFSNILAKQRAYSLKCSYMTQIFNKYVLNKEPSERILSYKSNKSFDEVIQERLMPFVGKSINELKKMFEIQSRAKNLNSMLLSRMLGLKGKVSNSEEFLKSGVEPKTISVSYTNKIKESISFPAFKFKDIVKEEWENSSLRNIFLERKYMFVIFKQHIKNGEFYFKGVKFWNMPLSDIDNELFKVWSKTVNVIKSGNIVSKIKDDGTRLTNFPHPKENKIAHVRPHGIDSNDTYELPILDTITKQSKYTKQCFWLNNSYIVSIIKDEL
jgi:DNA mismatch repair protein MutH